MGRNASRMRVLGIVLLTLSLGCLFALDESIEAGHTDIHEITTIPKTEVAEVVPKTTLKARASSEKLLEKKTGSKKGGAVTNLKKTGLTKKTGKKSGHWNKEGAYFHHVSTRLKKDLSKNSRKSGKSHVAKSYPAGWSKNAAVREKHVKRDKAYEAFKVKSEQFKKSEAEHKTKVEKKAKAQKLANEGKSKERARKKAALEKKRKKRGTEKQVKEQKAKEKRSKKPASESRGKANGKAKKAKELGAKEGAVKESKAKEKTIKQRKLKLSKEQAAKREKLAKSRTKEHKAKGFARES